MKFRLHLATALLMLVVVLPLVMIFLFQGWQWYIQHQMKEKLELESMHSVFIKQEDIRWVKKGKELRLHGKLFDVKQSAAKPGGLLVTGLYDEAETVIENMLSRQHNGSKSLLHILLLTRLFVDSNEINVLAIQPLFSPKPGTSFIHSNLVSCPRTTPAPPPKWMEC